MNLVKYFVLDTVLDTCCLLDFKDIEIQNHSPIPDNWMKRLKKNCQEINMKINFKLKDQFVQKNEFVRENGTFRGLQISSIALEQIMKEIREKNRH